MLHRKTIITISPPSSLLGVKYHLQKLFGSSVKSAFLVYKTFDLKFHHQKMQLSLSFLLCLVLQTFYGKYIFCVGKCASLPILKTKSTALKLQNMNISTNLYRLAGKWKRAIANMIVIPRSHCTFQQDHLEQDLNIYFVRLLFSDF